MILLYSFQLFLVVYTGCLKNEVIEIFEEVLKLALNTLEMKNKVFLQLTLDITRKLLKVTLYIARKLDTYTRYHENL